MTKRLFFMLGVIAGFLFAAMLHRKKMERLKTFEVEKAEQQARFDEYEREWQAKIAAMPFERRVDWQLFEASLKLDNYQPNWRDDDEESY